MDSVRGKAPARKQKVFATLAVVGIVCVLGALGTFAAFTATTTNPNDQITAGTVALSNNDSGSAMYNATGQKPGDVTERCLRVSYTGSLAASVRLYTTAIGSVGDHVDLTITPGTTAAGFSGCGSFTPDAKGAIYSGTLKSFADTYGSYTTGLADYPGSAVKWSGGDTVAYRFTLTVKDDFADNGATSVMSSGSHAFTFEARNGEYARKVLATSGLLSFWRLGEASGTTAQDSRGTSPGTYAGSPTLSQAGSQTDDDPSTRFTPATADRVDATVSGMNTTAGGWNTVEFWMYWEGGGAGQMPFGFNGYDLYLAGGRFGFNTAVSDLWGISSAGLSNRWVHIAGEFYNGDGKQSRLWINGQEKTLSRLTGTTTSRTASNNVRISGWRQDATNYAFNGRLDEVALYNRALSEAEIQEHYNAR